MASDRTRSAWGADLVIFQMVSTPISRTLGSPSGNLLPVIMATSNSISSGSRFLKKVLSRRVFSVLRLVFSRSLHSCAKYMNSRSPSCLNLCAHPFAGLASIGSFCSFNTSLLQATNQIHRSESSVATEKYKNVKEFY